jgi:hypothetical protein
VPKTDANGPKRRLPHTKDGKPYKSLVQRLINALKEDKLIKKESGRWVLTKKGVAVAEISERQNEIPF